MTGRTAARDRLLLWGAVLLPVAVVGYATHTSGFYWDDIINFRQAQVDGLSLGYLFEPTSAHIAPGHRLGDWIVQAFFPMNFRVAQAVMLFGFAATLFLFHRLLVELFARPRLMCLPTVLYGLSTVHVSVLQWWASGLDRLPATILTFVSMWAYVRFFRRGSRRALGLSVGAFALALLFFIKPVFIPLYLVLLRVLILHPDEPVRETITAAFGEWRVWLLYLVPLALYVPLYVRGYSSLQDPSASLLLEYAWVSWFWVLTPGFFGLYIPKHAGTFLSVAGVVAAQVALASLVAWSLARARGAWRAWVFLAVTLAANIAVVGLTRVGRFSPRFIAYLLYYHLEASYLFLIAVVAVFTRTAATQRPVPEHRPAPRWSPTTTRALVAAGVVVSVALALLGGSGVRGEYTWFGTPARQYIEAVDRGLRQARAAGGDELVLVNGTVPYPVVPDIADNYNSQSEVLPLIDDRLSFQAVGPDLFEVAQDGTVRPVTFTAMFGGNARDLLQGGSLAVLGAATRNSAGTDLCATAPSAAGGFALTLPAPLDGTGWHVQMSFASSTRQALALVAEPAPGKGPSKSRVILLNGEANQAEVLPLESSTLQRLYLVLSPGAEACLQGLEVGRLEPRP